MARSNGQTDDFQSGLLRRDAWTQTLPEVAQATGCRERSAFQPPKRETPKAVETLARSPECIT